MPNMFSVPGWSVSADNFQVEREQSKHSKSKNKKRKQSDREEINTSNVEELWDHHIQGNGKPKKLSKALLSERNSKRKKRENRSRQRDADNEQEERGHLPPQEDRSEIEGSKQEQEPSTQVIHSGKLQNGIKSKGNTNHATAQTIQPQPQPRKPKLTPLQAQMRQKLISSRFRYLNETLYTAPSSASQELFNQNPDFFSEYHQGFRRQVAAWPENPVDGFAKWLIDRGKIRESRDNPRFPKQRGQKRKQEPLSSNPASSSASSTADTALPRNASAPGVCTIADLGCGEAKLAQQIITSSASKQSKLDVKSYDLAAPNEFVTIADISALPLADSSVDVAIFCLALMGTNWIDFVEEAYRVLRWKGECWVAEVTSRFGAPTKKGERVEHSVGNIVKSRGIKRGKGKREREGEEEVDDEEGLGLAEETTAQTQFGVDTTAFVAVLRRRGLELQGQPETGNKMFVRMRFLKSLPAVRGKCANKGPRQSKKPKFIDRSLEEISVEEEWKVLKPCVYKTR